MVDLAQLENNLDSIIAVLNGFCDGCVMSHTCRRNCNRMNVLSKLVSDYIQLDTAFNLACAELSLDGKPFNVSTTHVLTKDEVKEYFLNGRKPR